jgi:uncharacterized membrane protein YhaH (DUF805 family)
MRPALRAPRPSATQTSGTTMSLKDFLLSPRGRVSRSRFWLAACLYVLGAGIVSALVFVLWQIIPGEEVDGEFKVNGAKSLPYLLLVFGYLIFCVWSGICVGIKRYHDRDKSGDRRALVPDRGGLPGRHARQQPLRCAAGPGRRPGVSQPGIWALRPASADRE